MSLNGKIPLDFVDNTGVTVTCLVSDPETCLTLDNPSLGERAPAPDEQLVGPKGEFEYVDLFPSPAVPFPSQAGLTWDQITLDWSQIPDTWDELT